jgi:hypothetical protein
MSPATLFSRKIYKKHWSLIDLQSLYNPFMPATLMLPRMSLAVRKGAIRVLLSVHDKMAVQEVDGLDMALDELLFAE